MSRCAFLGIFKAWACHRRIHNWLTYFANYVPISTNPCLLWTLQDKAINALAFCNAHQIAIQHLEILEGRSLKHKAAFKADSEIEKACTSLSIAEEVNSY